MAKIPMVNRPQIQGHQDDTVNVSGAPSLNWGIGNYYDKIGDSISKGLGNIGNAVSGVIKEDQALQETEDKTQLNELSLLETEQMGNAQQYFTENPTEYKNFGEYLTTLESDADERRKEIYEKMSPRAKEQASYYVRQNQLQRKQNMVKVQYQAQVTSQLKTMENQLTQAAKLGNWELAQQIIDSHLESAEGYPPLLSPQQAETLRAKYHEQQNFYEVKGLIDSDALVPIPRSAPTIKQDFASVKDTLKAKNADGTYKFYEHLTQEQRVQLTRYDEQKTANREVEQREEFIGKIIDGNPPKKEDIEMAKESGMMSQSMYNFQMKILSNSKEQVSSEQRKQNEEQQKSSKNRLLYEILEFKFPGNPAEVQKDFADFHKRILEEFGTDSEFTVPLMKALKEKRLSATKPDKSYMNQTSYIYGLEKIRNESKKGFDTKDIYGRWYWYDKEGTDEARTANKALLGTKFNEWYVERAKQGKPPDQKDINEFIENFKTDLSKQYFSDVINNWGIIPKVSTDTSQSVPEKDPNIIIKRGRAGTPYEGQYFIHNKATNKTTKATYEELQKYHTVQ